MERFWKTAVDSTEMSVGGVRERGKLSKEVWDFVRISTGKSRD